CYWRRLDDTRRRRAESLGTGAGSRLTGLCPNLGNRGISWDYMAVKKVAQNPPEAPLKQVNAINGG
ncbi:MAG: hypothetical protein WBE32_04745, partial [Pseudolabrys sp.]